MPRLRIVAINDVYTLENFPRLRTLIDRVRVEEPVDALLVTVAGDFLAPSLLSSLDQGRGMVDGLNAIGATHVTFGNHEDDVPTTALRHATELLKARWLSTNVSGFSLPDHEVIDVAGVKVGLIGVVTDDPALYRRSPFGGAPIEPPNKTALAWAARLASGGCESVIALTHQSLTEDRVLAASGVFPVIVGGHEHEAHCEQIGRTSVVKAGSDALQAAIIDLTWPGPAVSVRFVPVSLYPEDPEVRARVDGHMAKVVALHSATLLKLAPGQTLSSVDSRRKQTSLGALLCSRIRDTLGAECALFNGGGVRGSKDYSERFTYGDLEVEVPFDNEIVVVSLPGRVLDEAIFASRAHAPVASGGFLQTCDNVVVVDKHVAQVGEALFHPASVYRVAMPRDLLTGMDHIEPLEKFAQEYPALIPPPLSGRGVKLVLVEAFARSIWEQLGGFDAVDLNQDGRVTQEEIKEAVARTLREPPSPVTAALIVSALDQDQDSSVSREEAKPRPKNQP